MGLSRVASRLINKMGSDVNVFGKDNNSDKPDIKSFALKNSKGKEIFFQFSDAQDINIGDIIVQAGAKTRWEVIDIEDIIVQGSYSHFEAQVIKQGKSRQGINPSQQNITYNINGANSRINNQSTDNSTNIQTSNNEDVSGLINKLREEILNLGAEKSIEVEALEVVDVIESQALQQKPNKTIIKSMVNGLQTLIPHAANAASIASMILAALGV